MNILAGLSALNMVSNIAREWIAPQRPDRVVTRAAFESELAQARTLPRPADLRQATPAEQRRVAEVWRGRVADVRLGDGTSIRGRIDGLETHSSGTFLRVGGATVALDRVASLLPVYESHLGLTSSRPLTA